MKERLEPRILHEVLKIYKPNWRFLTSAKSEDSNYYGVFKLDRQCPYLLNQSKLNHITEIELDNCISQLCYTSIADMMTKKRISELNDYDFSKLQKNGILTIDSKKKFRKTIPRSIFNGQIKLVDMKTERGTSILQYTGSFKDKSMILKELRVVIKP